jgi:hypothetical protein
LYFRGSAGAVQELFKHGADAQELFELGGFSNVLICSEQGGLFAVIGGVGGTEDHDRNVIPLGYVADTAQHIFSAPLGQIQIQNYELRTGLAGAIELFNELNGLLAISEDEEFRFYLMLVESLFHQKRIRGVIFDKQDGNG